MTYVLYESFANHTFANYPSTLLVKLYSACDMIEEGENVGHVMEEVRRCIVFDVLLQLEILFCISCVQNYDYSILTAPTSCNTPKLTTLHFIYNHSLYLWKCQYVPNQLAIKLVRY